MLEEKASKRTVARFIEHNWEHRNAFISRPARDKYEDAGRIYSAWISIDFEIVRLAPARNGIGNKFSRIRESTFGALSFRIRDA